MAAGFPNAQTFSFEALLSEDADKSEELGDLLQIQNRGVVELDDG